MTSMKYDVAVFPELATFFEGQRTALENQSRYVRDNCRLEGQLGLALSFMKDTYNNSRDVAVEAFDTAGEVAGALSTKVTEYLADLNAHEDDLLDQIKQLEEELAGLKNGSSNETPGGGGTGGGGTGGGGTGGGGTGGGGTGGGGTGAGGGSGGPSIPAPTAPLPEAAIPEPQPVIPVDPLIPDPELEAIPGAGTGFEWDDTIARGFDPEGTWIGPGGFGPDDNWYGPGGFGPDGLWHGPGALGADGEWYGPGGIGPDGNWYGEGGFADDGDWYGPRGIGPDGQWYGPGQTDDAGDFLGPADGSPVLPTEPLPGETTPPDDIVEPLDRDWKIRLDASIELSPDKVGFSVDLMSGEERIAHAQDSFELDREELWKTHSGNDPLGRTPAELSKAWAQRDRFTLPSTASEGITFGSATNPAEKFSLWGVSSRSIAELKNARD